MSSETHIRVMQQFDAAPMKVDEYVYRYNFQQFVLDFKSVTPQSGPGGQPMQLFMTHKVVVLDPLIAKTLAEQLRKAVAEYEKKFGKIKKSEAQLKAEAEAQQTASPAKGSRPSYMG